MATIWDTRLGAAERDAAWRALLTLIAPRVEAWAHPVLRRCRLTGADEPRTVLVGVPVRLSGRSCRPTVASPTCPRAVRARR